MQSGSTVQHRRLKHVFSTRVILREHSSKKKCLLHSTAWSIFSIFVIAHASATNDLICTSVKPFREWGKRDKVRENEWSSNKSTCAVPFAKLPVMALRRGKGEKRPNQVTCVHFLVTCRWHDISCRLSNFPIVTLTICVTRVIILPTILSTNCDTWHCFFYFNVQYFDLILHSTPIPSFSLQFFLFSVEAYVTCHEGAETCCRHQWSITGLHLFLCADARSYTLQSVSHWCLHHQLPWLQHHTQTRELGAKYRNHSSASLQR